MATDWAMYNPGILAIGNGTDLSSGTFRLGLLSSSYMPSPTADTTWGDISGDEIASVDNGYTAGGTALTGLDLQESGGNVKWDANNVTFTQSGANELGPSRYGVIYDVTNGSRLICYTDFQQDVELTNGSAFIVEIPTTGILIINETP